MLCPDHAVITCATTSLQPAVDGAPVRLAPGAYAVDWSALVVMQRLGQRSRIISRVVLLYAFRYRFFIASLRVR